MIKLPTTYELFIAPFSIPEFGRMERTEAERHFEWFVSQQAIRIDHLSQVALESGVLPGALDFSPVSLIALWRWARQFAARDGLSRGLRRDWAAARLDIVSHELSVETKSLAVDVGFYWAQVFMQLSPNVKWVLCLENGHVMNKPILAGFSRTMFPPDVAAAQFFKTLRGEGVDEDLHNCAAVWSGNLVR